jgi:hypothetical protein
MYHTTYRDDRVSQTVDAGGDETKPYDERSTALLVFWVVFTVWVALTFDLSSFEKGFFGGMAVIFAVLATTPYVHAKRQ